MSAVYTGARGNQLRLMQLVGGAALLGLSLLLLRALSSKFAYGTAWLERPTVTAVSLMVAGGMSYFLACWSLYKRPPGKAAFAALLVAGGLMRLMWIGSTPIYEDDFYRYFFDGEMVANGLNPYMHTPADALPDHFSPLGAHLLPADQETPDPTEITLKQIGEARQVNRVAYPYIRTIYPPVSQVFFLVHHYLASWSLDAWRMMLFAIDLVSLFLLCRLVQVYGRPVGMTMIFWLNPLVITETMNAGHMDALLLPFLLATALLANRSRYGWAGVALAGAVGVKLWPVVLAPVLFAKLASSITRLAAAATPFVVFSGLIMLPQVLAKLDATSGLAAYAESWQVNALLFSIIAGVTSIITENSDFATRVAVAALVGAVALKLFFSAAKEKAPFSVAGFLTVTASLFLLSPTGYPWYFIWLIPWLVIFPSPALLLLTALLPLYDLRYPMSLTENQALFDTFVVTIEFLPSLILLGFAGYQRLQRQVPA